MSIFENYKFLNLNYHSICKKLLIHYDILDSLKSSINSCSNSPQCSKGCSQCCSDYFEVTQPEFLLILDYIHSNLPNDFEMYFQKAKRSIKKLAKRYPQVVQLLLNNKSPATVFSIEKYNVNLPCMFLDSTNNCSIYPIRPHICRVHGNFYNHNYPLSDFICKKLGSIDNNISNMLDTTELDEYYKNNFFYNTISLGSQTKTISPTTYPIYFWYYKMFSNTSTYDGILHNPLLGGYLTLSHEEHELLTIDILKKQHLI